MYKTKNEITKQNSAITLIALVITIIVLLILVAVTLNIVIGENGIFSKAKISKEKVNYSSAKEIVNLKVFEVKSNIVINGGEFLDELDDSINNDEDITTEKYYYKESAVVRENGKKLNGIVVSVKEYSKYKFLIGKKSEKKYIVGISTKEVNDLGNIWNGEENTLPDGFISIEEFEENELREIITSNNEQSSQENTENQTIQGDTMQNIQQQEFNEVEIQEYDSTKNVFSYSRGARVTYVTNPFGTDGKYINNGYTGYTSAVNNNTDSFWLDGNEWNVQGCLENDNSIDNINLNHNGDYKDSRSSTTMPGDSSEKKIIIIDPRAYYGDTQDYLFEIDNLYLASANSDGNVGNYTVYISSGDSSVATNPNDTSWVQVTTGRLTQDGKLIKVYSENLKFKYLKLELYSRNQSYMELAAIKAFKRFGTLGESNIAVTINESKANMLLSNQVVGIKEVQLVTPEGYIAKKKYTNYPGIARAKFDLYVNGEYTARLVNKNNEIKEITFSVGDATPILGNSFEYSGNLFKYSQGTRVTYVTNPFGADGKYINNGYTGYTSAVNNNTDSFWLDGNGWNVQGCLENDDSKNNISLNHNGDYKDSRSSTTMEGDDKKNIIIAPRTFQGDFNDYFYETNEIYLASADSDGNVGKYEIYISMTDLSTNPNNENWLLLTSGRLENDGRLTKVYEGNIVKFKNIKIVAYTRDKSYMELAAIKIFK